MSGLVDVITVRAKPPGSIAVVPMAEEKDTLPGSVAFFPGGRTGVDSNDRVLAADTGGSIPSDMKGILPTPVADGSKTETDGDLLVKNTIVTTESRIGLRKFARNTRSTALWCNVARSALPNNRPVQITLLAVRPRSDESGWCFCVCVCWGGGGGGESTNNLKVLNHHK